MFWTGFFIGFAACLAIGLTAHFIHDRVSDRRSLPVFRLRIVKDSGALRRSRATGTPSATYCITNLKTMNREQKITFGSDGHQRLEARVPKAGQA